MFNLHYKGVSQSPQCCRTRPEHSLCGSFTNRKLLVQLGSHHDFTYVSMCPQKAVNHRLKWPSISTLGLRPSLSVKPRTSSVSRQPIDRPSSRPQTQRDLAWMTLRIHLETESKNLQTLEMSESQVLAAASQLPSHTCPNLGIRTMAQSAKIGFSSWDLSSPLELGALW